MFESVRNIYNYCKYGKVVYKSTNGNVIRKKIVSPNIFNPNSPEIKTTKTVLNSNSKVELQMNRWAYKDGERLTTSTYKTFYNPENGNFLARTNDIDYQIRGNSKKIVDYTKPGYDYSIKMLPDGKQAYSVAFPEVTLIEEGKPVRTTNTRAVCIK